MGKRTNNWVQGVLILSLVGGLLIAGVSINQYLGAKAASNEPKNQKKTNQITMKKHGGEKVTQMKNGSNLDTELLNKDQKESYSHKPDQETSNLPENKTTEEHSATTNIDSPRPLLEANTVQTEQTNAPQVNTNSKTVYLTFDDGPESFSSEIIALLEKYHFKATFFMLDGNIKKYPNSARLMVKMGESVGLHGVTHSRKLFYASVVSVLGEMNQDRNTLKEITGVDSVLIRTPFGSVPNLTPEEKKAVLDNGYLMWDWNIDSRDWYFKDGRFVDNVIEQLQRKARKAGPIVILMHEKKETLAQLPRLFDYLSQNHYECKVIDRTVDPIHF
ncbi:polysaccharide deacetylase family protein [Bacillus sp. EB600]|uniref:polysaccharide deacetylase family protein n=1 Tax=Bacillus sp. EB600 TaxID=2806345 RepID=UPI00210E2624|nr:polysaccharide deacetylase family protein [Bacillus sp. EB600]MCQ6282924.1 polysaccharide deacetylase family protein [Bacillus sp. EB600]